MKLRRLASLLLLAAAFATASCTNDILDDEWSGGTTTTLTIETELPELGGTTRAEGDNSAKGGVVNIDWSKYNLRIKARAYDTKDNTKYDEVIEYWESADDIGTIEIPMSVTNGRMYDIYVWADIVLADNHSDLHYNTENLPTVTYTEGDGPAINDETYDAFFGYGRARATSMGVTWDTAFSLQRAVSKLRIVAEDSDNSATSATVAIEGILYRGIKFGGNISYSGDINTTQDSGDIISYNSDTSDATTMITAYLLTPEVANYTITATLYTGSSEINSISVSDVPLKRGHLTTLRGSMFSSGGNWDGSIEVPTQFDGEWMVINTPGELLWLATAAEAPKVNGTTYSKFRLGKDIDMVGTTIESLRIGNGATFDGNGKTIKGFGAATSALFGSAQGLTAYNFTIDGYNATAATTHIGVLVNELTGSTTFTDITVKNSSAVTTNGAAGGMVGYIDGGNSIDLNVNFENCNLINVTAEGSSAEGKFVGLMCGFDNGETLSFDASCSVDTNCAVADYTSPYNENNDAQWLDDADKAPFDFTKYNGWLGNEENYRAIVNFAGHRLQIKWDGTTKIAPLKSSNNEILIYSPFDLASLQQTVTRNGSTYTWSNRTNHNTVIFMNDVDLGGVCDSCRENNCICTKAGYGMCTCTECRKFTPIYSIKTLEGNNHTVYNLHIEMIHDNLHGAGFMQTTVNGSNHRNINFIGANIKTDHDRNIPTLSYAQEDNGSGNAYGGTFVAATGSGTYTISNVHVSYGKVSGVCKIGGLIGRATCATLNMSDCSVDHYVVENYQANKPNYYPIQMNTGSYIVTCLGWWYTQGECGGLIGFVQCSSRADIIRCSVTNTFMNCYGQEDKSVTANVISASNFTSISPSAKDSTLGRGTTLIAGRHVNQFIGDVVSARASDGANTYIVNIEDYFVEGNSYLSNNSTVVSASNTNDFNHAYAQKNTGSSWRPNYVDSAWCEVVGCAYYVGVEINILTFKKHVRYYAGTLTYNKQGGSSVTLTESVSEANGIKWIGGDFNLSGVFGKVSYPAAPTLIGE